MARVEKSWLVLLMVVWWWWGNCWFVGWLEWDWLEGMTEGRGGYRACSLLRTHARARALAWQYLSSPVRPSAALPFSQAGRNKFYHANGTVSQHVPTIRRVMAWMGRSAKWFLDKELEEAELVSGSGFGIPGALNPDTLVRFVRCFIPAGKHGSEYGYDCELGTVGLSRFSCGPSVDLCRGGGVGGISRWGLARAFSSQPSSSTWSCVLADQLVSLYDNGATSVMLAGSRKWRGQFFDDRFLIVLDRLRCYGKGEKMVHRNDNTLE
ncbi:hypothetical protein HOY82DRAFT_539478 [Tuber indicum]|nr:hypothetical protein HOY82DRAFT_539478 [Tuber indicum]